EPELNPADNTVTVGVPAAVPAVPSTPAPPPVQKAERSAPTLVKPPAVRGSRRVGATLRATPPTWTAPPTALRYQWQVCSRTACVAIPHATTLSIRVDRTA